jgi:hypothetical protein
MKYLKISLVALVVVTISIIIFFYSCSNKKIVLNKTINSVGNSMGNLNNDGVVTEQGDNTFFVNAKSRDVSTAWTALGTNCRLFVVKDNSSKATKLNNFVTGYNISVVGNKIFYEGLLGGDGFMQPSGLLNLYDIDKNTTKELQVAGDNYCIVNDYIYAKSSDDTISKYNLDGKNFFFCE